MSGKELKAVGENPVAMREMTKEETAEFCAVREGIEAERRIEDGEVLSVYEGLYTNGKSKAVLQVRKYKQHDYTDVKVIAEFAEKNKLLRVKIPLPEEFKDGVAVGDGPFAFKQKPNCECVFQKWFGVQNKEGKIFSVINDCLYAGKVEDGYIHLTLLCGVGYCFHPIFICPCIQRIDIYLELIRVDLRLNLGLCKETLQTFTVKRNFSTKPPMQ